jgi:hypothetical protein
LYYLLKEESKAKPSQKSNSAKLSVSGLVCVSAESWRARVYNNLLLSFRTIEIQVKLSKLYMK